MTDPPGFINLLIPGSCGLIRATWKQAFDLVIQVLLAVRRHRWKIVAGTANELDVQ